MTCESNLHFNLDPDPNCQKTLDIDPNKRCADPKHWYELYRALTATRIWSNK